MSASAATGAWHAMGNVRIWTGQERVYAVNDNEGNDFEFRKLADGSGWVLPLAYQRSRDSPQLDESVSPDSRALASITATDVLLVGLEHGKVMPGLDLSPMRVSGRAAWYSLGFLLRSAASSFLDVDPNEFRVGLRTLSREGQWPEGEVFLSDFLENGAGYSTYIGRPEVFPRFLRYVIGNFAPRIEHHGPQRKSCDSSCYDCIRDYSNMAYHGLLDWRLALDMARLADGQEIGLSGYWDGIADDLMTQFCEDFADSGWVGTKFGPLPGAERHGRALIAVHPLWDIRPNFCVENLGEAIAAAEERGFRQDGQKQWTAVSIFDLLRRPAWVEAEVWRTTA